MSISKRQEQIVELLQESGFLTVSRLSKLTYTSESSIRRDLTRLQNCGMVKRTHGGAALPGEHNQPTSLSLRMIRNIPAKKKIAKKAATLLRDGQSVMLDGSSTASFLVPYIARHKDMHVFTNNMQTAIAAIGYGIDTVCIGGHSVNRSPVLVGPDAEDAVMRLCPDILFFSSRDLATDGTISDPVCEENYIRKLMLENARRSVFLCDLEKVGDRSLYALTNLSYVDVAVFDEIPIAVRASCKQVL